MIMTKWSEKMLKDEKKVALTFNDYFMNLRACSHYTV